MAHGGESDAAAAAEGGGIYALPCGHKTNDLRGECPQCKLHFCERERAATDPAPEGGGMEMEPPVAPTSHGPSPLQVPLPQFPPLPQASITAGKLLILSELNGVLVWRDYDTKKHPSHCDTVEMPSGKNISIFIRPGAEQLVASLLWEARCDFAFVSGMCKKYCLPIAEALLKRAAPKGEWAFELHGAVPCWVLEGHPHARVYVLSREIASLGQGQGGERVVKDLDSIWSALRECGCGGYTEENTVLLDQPGNIAFRPEIVRVVPRWGPPADDTKEDTNPLDPELGHKLLAGPNAGDDFPPHFAAQPDTPYCGVADSDFTTQLYCEFYHQLIYAAEWIGGPHGCCPPAASQGAV